MALSDTPGAAGAREAQRHGERAARSRQYDWLARAGLVARGVVYAVIGLLALQLALTDGGKATTQQGALKEVAQQPFGKGLLVVLAVGLAGFALWRLLRAALGHGHSQDDHAGERLVGIVSGVGYGLLCFTAIKILAGAGAGSSSPKEATGGVLDWPAGPYLVGIAGAVLIGAGVWQLYQGVTRGFLDDSTTGRMGPGVLRALTGLGVFGHIARGVVFGLIGYGLIRAALDYDADEAVGLDGALRNVQDASYGTWLLAAVAIGLLGFAAYSALDAKYHKL